MRTFSPPPELRADPDNTGESRVRKVLIIGGVAGGATCAARLRRLDEQAEIIVLERGPYASFANCGLPYYVGGVIQEEAKLLQASPGLFRQRFRIDVRTQHEALSIDREKREVAIRDLVSGKEYREPYDALVLSPGASPVVPPLEGIRLPGVFTVRTVPDSAQIREWIERHNAKRAVVIGGGFIGLEMVENLAHRGLEVTLVEAADQLMPPLDPEMAQYVHQRAAAHIENVRVGDPVAGFETDSRGALLVRTKSGLKFGADLVILSIGVRPETKLAREAGLEIGSRGGIRVDEQMQTSDPHIWAVGDAVEVRNAITGEWQLCPLAGPAQRQARVAAASICGREAAFRGVQGTAIVGLFGLTAAITGESEKALRRTGFADYEAVYLHPGHHAGYYPGAKPIHMKLLFRRSDGLVLGAQAVGEADVARRIDVISMAIQKGATVFDLEEAELCYAPQYGSAKDPVNMAGMIAANALRGDIEIARWTHVGSDGAMVLDVREPGEHHAGAIPGAVNIPLGQLRQRLEELPRDREIQVACAVGQRAYYACRLLRQHGFRATLLSGGYRTYKTLPLPCAGSVVQG
jgi:NADPH-dependent 2,4-dienoyl-CoA reductase/sulfur reductase-like enzyme/rhodanese-related sulfurtransferase